MLKIHRKSPFTKKKDPARAKLFACLVKRCFFDGGLSSKGKSSSLNPLLRLILLFFVPAGVVFICDVN